MNKVNIGLIGCGNIAQWGTNRGHVPSLRAVKDANLVMVCDVSEKAARHIADPMGVPYTTDRSKLLERKDIDAVIIAVPHKFHKEIAVDASEAGKHVMCEKPLAMNTSEVDEMIAASEKNNVILMTAENYLFDPGIHQIARLIDSGLLGKVHTVELDELGDWSVPGSLGFQGLTWNVKKDLAGGGVLISSGVHFTAIATRFAGDVDGVTAKMAIYYPEFQGNYANVEDEATAILDHKGGTLTTIHVSAIDRFPYHKVEVHGEKGSVMYHDMNGKPEMVVSGFNATLPPTPNEFPSSESYRNELEHFVHCVMNGEKPMTNARVGRLALEIVLKGYESAEKNVRVRM